MKPEGKASIVMRKHVLCAGGLLDEKGKMKGSLPVMEFESREELDGYLNAEPYIQENVWEKYRWSG